MKTLQHTWKYILIFIIFSWSCKIEDDHGTVEFVLFNDDFESLRGTLLGEYYTYENFIVNEQSKEVYLINCGGQICEPHIIKSLNFETGSSRKIYESLNPELNIILADYIPSTNTLYFWENNYLEQHLIAFDVNTLKYKIIPATQAYTSTSFATNVELLGVRGLVRQASQDTPEILIQNSDWTSQLIYNYETNSTRLTRPFEYNILKFYPWRDDKLYYLTDYYGQIKNFLTDEILFSPASPDQYLIDFNPTCMKVVYFEEKILDSSSQYQYKNIQLRIKDINSGETDIPVNINTYNEFIGMAKLLDDGKTIIYTINEQFYKATID